MVRSCGDHGGTCPPTSANVDIDFGAGRKRRSLSLLLCLDKLVSYVIAHGGSTYYLGGFLRHLTPAVKSVTVMMSVSACVSESILAVVLKDDRLPLILPEVDRITEAELDFLAKVPTSVWNVLAGVAGGSGPKLRHDCIAGAVTSAGFVHGHLREARKGPWALLKGDWRANLRHLARQPEPVGDEVLYKIHKLMQFGLEDLCMDGLEKLSRCSWTTMAEEQGHVAASSLLKLHKQYGIQTLQCRAMVCQARPLFAENPIHKKIDAKSKQKEALTSKQTNRITGRHLFLRGLHREADRMLSDGRSMPSDMRNTIFMKHGGRWNNLHPEKKAKFDDQVEHARDEAEAAARDKVQKLDEEIEELRQQLAKDRPDERPLRMSDCRFSQEDLVEMEALGETAEFSAANVAIRRDEAARKLQPPHPSVGKALASIDISMPKEKSKVPDGSSTTTPTRPMVRRSRCSCAMHGRARWASKMDFLFQDGLL